MFSRRILFFTLLAVVGYVNPAHAITATLEPGTATNPNTGNSDGGAFTTLPNTTTIDFNSTPLTTSTGANSYTFTSPQGNIVFNWNSSTTPITGIKQGGSNIGSNNFAPLDPNGNINNSHYLSVYQASPVTIDLPSNFGYYGLDWGYADQYNQIQFYNNSQLVGSFSTNTTTNPGTTLVPLSTKPEQSSYVSFNSQSASDTFNRIVITDTGTTGFETDNHSFRNTANPAAVPAPPVGLVGWLVVGSISWLMKRKVAHFQKIKV